MTSLRDLIVIARRDLGLKILALVLAGLAWVYAHGEQTNEATFLTPIEYVLPADLVLMNDDPLPDQVVIVASGTRAALARVQEVSLRYMVDLEAAVAGSTEHSFRTPPPGWPPSLRITTVSPAMIRVKLDERSRRTVPVQLRTRGELPPGFVQTGHELEPNEVVLVGAHQDLMELDFVRTTPLDLKRASTGVDADIPLDLTGLHLLPESATKVRLRMQVEEVIAGREYGDVKLRFGGDLVDRADLKLSTASAVVHLEGPVPLLDALRSDSLVLELSGPPASLPEPGAPAIEVPWVEDGEGLGVRLRIDHPRSDRLRVLKLAPKKFGLSVLLPPKPAQPEEGNPGQPEGPTPQ